MAQAEDKFDLDFTTHFESQAVEAEPVPQVPVAEKLTLDPNFRIGASKLETEGFFVALARRGPGTGKPAEQTTIMLVEDEPVTNAVLQKVLVADGFRAFGAFDAVGLGKLLKEHGLPDLFMLDIELPRVSGLQILSRIRKHPKLAAIPACIVTSKAEMSDVVRGFSLGANGYLSKPVTVESLRSVLRQILGIAAKS
jgi:CheY-like chemotaxis protein